VPPSPIRIPASVRLGAMTVEERCCPGKAQVLRRSLHTLRADGLGAGLGSRVLGWGGMMAAVGSFVRPQGPGVCCDKNGLERVLNVITSLPFMAVGLATMRRRRTPEGKIYGASIVGVGMASMTFHAAKGRFRSFSRKLDYWTIAVSSALMSRALFPNLSPLVWGLSLGLTPFQPFATSSANTVAMEYEFLRRASQNPSLKPVQQLHAVTSAGGMGLFCLGDTRPDVPCTHCLWHCAAALSCATTNGLLADVEERTLGLTRTL